MMMMTSLFNLLIGKLAAMRTPRDAQKSLEGPGAHHALMPSLRGRLLTAAGQSGVPRNLFNCYLGKARVVGLHVARN